MQVAMDTNLSLRSGSHLSQSGWARTVFRISVGALFRTVREDAKNVCICSDSEHLDGLKIFLIIIFHVFVLCEYLEILYGSSNKSESILTTILQSRF